MVLAMCFAGVGCLGIGDGFDFFDDLFSRFQNGEISEQEYYDRLADMDTQLYGTKILYRPESYDFDGNSGGTEEQPNDYYGKYAWQILSRLELIYGVADDSAAETPTETDPDKDLYGYYTFYDDTLPYLYDSIRYQVDRQMSVTKAITVTDDSVSEQPPVDYVALSANLENAWNWSFDLAKDVVSLQPYFYNAQGVLSNFYNEENNTLSAILLENDMSAIKSSMEGFYTNTISSNYLTTYVGTGDPADYDNYSDYVKALEYAIYRYAIDLEPGQVVVSPTMTTITNEDGTSTIKYYTVKVIETRNGIQIEYTIDEALEKAKADFEIIGGYVGISERNRIKLAQWILTNVIGEKAMSNDNVTEYTGATQVTYTDANGESYTFVVTNEDEANKILDSLEYTGADLSGTQVPTATETSEEDGTPVHRNYQDTIINMVNLVCDQVTIGSDEEEGDVTVDERYLASEIIEYWGESFVAGGDEDPFPYYEDFSTVTAGAPVIQPLEYQNVLFMFKEEVNVTAVTITFQYDADLDGYSTASGYAIDGNRYLTIEVTLNFYDHETDTLTTVGSQMVNVPDGKMQNPWGDEELEKAEDRYFGEHGTSITFSQMTSFGVDESIMGRPSQDLIVGAFNTDIGNGILMTDVGRNDYKGNPLVSKTPLTLTGNSRVKDYYSIIEPTDEQIAQGETWLTGQLNKDMFSGNDGCDYLEVVYRVVKRVGDTENNYKFYTAADVVTG